MFVHRHLVQFYETDLMGIIHHSNYLRFYEEARVAWAHAQGLIDYQQPGSAAHFAVLETQVKHLRPGRFGDSLEIDVQARRDGVRVIFQYRLRRGGEVLSVAETRHVPLSAELKPIRLPLPIKTVLEKETWTETWLLNS
ncbi:MAG: acyl-CoA thioesterase [Bdellovibrionaceae bacterium]|nr:acyl-CoA thioesterase [Pseudobdellovibrionaceae bacterium]